MQSHNPYAPPQTSVLETSLPGGPLEPATQLTYAGFWRRFGAFWIDAMIQAAAGWTILLVSQQLRLSPGFWALPGLLVNLFFNVHLVHRFGATPGLLLLKMRIAMVDGTPVKLRAATLRYSVLFVLTTLGSIATLMASLSMTTEEYYSLSLVERGRQVLALAPSWYASVSILFQCWVWGEFVSLLFNKKRRAIQDFMAGTVVLHLPRPAR
jgi:uncharacterized RDD family membrane protein YckC